MCRGPRFCPAWRFTVPVTAPPPVTINVVFEQHAHISRKQLTDPDRISSHLFHWVVSRAGPAGGLDCRALGSTLPHPRLRACATVFVWRIEPSGTPANTRTE